MLPSSSRLFSLCVLVIASVPEVRCVASVRDDSAPGPQRGPRASDAWLRLNAWHEFYGSPTTEFSSATGYVPFTADLGDSWGEVGLGGATHPWDVPWTSTGSGPTAMIA